MSKKTMGAVLLIALSTLSAHEARAQSDDRKFEVGGQFSLLSFPTVTITTTVLPCVSPPCPVQTSFAEDRESDPGFGGRLGYNFSRHIGIEAEGNFFPRDRDLVGGRKTQALFGAKVGKRFDKVGLFAKSRPGFVRFSKGDYRPVGGCITLFPPPIACFQRVAKTNFAFDLGGAAEWYPSKNTLVRFDAGDTVIRFGARNAAAVNVPAAGLSPVRLVIIPVAAETKHNFQASVGFGFRF